MHLTAIDVYNIYIYYGSQYENKSQHSGKSLKMTAEALAINDYIARFVFLNFFAGHEVCSFFVCI